MNNNEDRIAADSEGESYRSIFKSMARHDLEEIAVRLSSDSAYWKSLYMKVINNTTPEVRGA